MILGSCLFRTKQSEVGSSASGGTGNSAMRDPQGKQTNHTALVLPPWPLHVGHSSNVLKFPHSLKLKHTHIH